MVEKDTATLKHIARHCKEIRSFVERFGNDFNAFTQDRAYFNAVSMCILQIGELSGNLSEEFKKETSKEIPWSTIKGMRNIVAHGYETLDEKIVWETATIDIPLLLDFCTSKICE